MYAVFNSGGKQHRVEIGTLLDVEKIEVAIGETIEFSNVLAVSDRDGNLKIGQPHVENSAVICEVVDQVKGKKIRVFKSKRRKGYKRRIGHRQQLTRVRITEIR